MSNKYFSTVATFLYLCSIIRISNAFSGDDLSAIQKLASLGNFENEAEEPEPDVLPFLGDPGREYRPYSLVDILNTKVKSERDLCSQENVRQYLRTGNLGFLIQCKVAVSQRQNNASQTRQSDYTPPAKPPKTIETYSGKLLKRLFANGLSKFSMPGNSPRAEIDGDVNDDVMSDESPVKRSRLSINGALGSLVDMLHQESRKHRRPVYAFHRELLHLG